MRHHIVNSKGNEHLCGDCEEWLRDEDILTDCRHARPASAAVDEPAVLDFPWQLLGGSLSGAQLEVWSRVEALVRRAEAPRVLNAAVANGGFIGFARANQWPDEILRSLPTVIDRLIDACEIEPAFASVWRELLSYGDSITAPASRAPRSTRGRGRKVQSAR